MERRSLKKTREEVARVASPLDCEAQGIIDSFAKLNMKVAALIWN